MLMNERHIGRSVRNQNAIRRRTPLRVRTTKPVTSPSRAPRGTFTRTGSTPGTVTCAGVETEAAPLLSPTFQTPAPPPASDRVRLRVAREPGLRRPNVNEVGLENTSG